MDWPVEGSREDGWYDLGEPSKGMIKYYDLSSLEEKVYMNNVSGFYIDNRNGHIITISNKEVRILDLKTPISKEILSKPKCEKNSGRIDFNRIGLSIDINQNGIRCSRKHGDYKETISGFQICQKLIGKKFTIDIIRL